MAILDKIDPHFMRQEVTRADFLDCFWQPGGVDRLCRAEDGDE